MSREGVQSAVPRPPPPSRAKRRNNRRRGLEHRTRRRCRAWRGPRAQTARKRSVGSERQRTRRGAVPARGRREGATTHTPHRLVDPGGHQPLRTYLPGALGREPWVPRIRMTRLCDRPLRGDGRCEGAGRRMRQLAAASTWPRAPQRPQFPECRANPPRAALDRGDSPLGWLVGWDTSTVSVRGSTLGAAVVKKGLPCRL